LSFGERRDFMRYVKAVGLALIASLSLLAFTAVSVQAQTHNEKLLILEHGTHEEKLHAETLDQLKGDWKWNGTLLSLTVNVNGALYDAANSSMLVPALNFAIGCHELEVETGTILKLEGGRSFGHVEVKFLGCLPLAHESLASLPFCKIFEKEEGVDEGEMTAAALFHVVRTAANGTAYVLIEPTGAGGLNERVFADVYLNEECPIEGLIEIGRGTLVAELGKLLLPSGTWDPVLEAEKPLLKEASHAIKLLFGDRLKFGEHDAFLDGDIEVFAAGVHAEKPIGIEAGS
jgi:hypothetical protein